MRTGRTRYGAGDTLAVPALRKDGVLISVEFTIVLFLAEDGSPSGIAAVVRDVTRRFEETRALQKEVARLKASGAAERVEGGREAQVGTRRHLDARQRGSTPLA